MARLRPRTASVGDRSDLVQHSPALGITPLRPSPPPATIVQNLAASLIGNIQEDIRCACHIEKNLYSGDNQGTILSWNTLDASRTTFYDGLGAPVNVVVGVNENKDIWVGLANGNIMILNLETKTLKGQMIHAHDAAVNCIAVGIQCAWSGGDDFLIKKWDLQGVELFSYNHHHGFIKDLLILRNGSAESRIKLWGASSDTSISVAALQDNIGQHTSSSDIKMLNAQSKGVSALCLVSADAIWSGYEDGSIVVWSSLGVLRGQVQQAHRGPVGSFVVMGAHVWSGSGDHTVLVWESCSLQLLFSLGDHGGFVKSMVRVEYMCWVFASGKNVRVWCAQSVWDLYEGEKDRLTRTAQKLKESLEKAQRDQQSLENAGKKSQQDLQAIQQQLNEQRSSGVSAVEQSNAEIDRLKSELAKTNDDLAEARESAQKNSGNLDERIQILLGKLSQLKAEKDAADKEAKTKMQGLEKDHKNLSQEHKKTLEDLGLMKKELEAAQTGLANSDKKGDSLLAQREVDNQKAIELEKTLKAANDKNELLQKDLARSVKGKEDATEARTRVQAEFEAKRVELEGKLKLLQENLDKAGNEANTNLTLKDAEMQKLQEELKKKGKALKKALKDAAEEKKRSAKEHEGLKEVIDQLKNSQEASSSTNAESSEKLASLELELQNTRDNLQKALSDEGERDAALAALEKTNEDLRKSISDLEQALKEKEESLNDSVTLQDKIQKLEQDLENTRDSLQKALSGKGERETALEKTNEELTKSINHLEQALKERDESVNDSVALQGKIQELEQKLKGFKDAAALSDALGQALAKERDELSKTNEDLRKNIYDLEEAIRERDESVTDSVSLRAKIQELEQNLQGFKDAAAVSDASEQALTKERDELAKLLSDSMAEIQNLKDRLSEVTSSAASEAGVVQELRNVSEKALRDLQTAEQSRAELEKSKEDQKAKHSEELAKLEDSLGNLTKDNAQLKELLAQASAELEKARADRASEEDNSGQISLKLEQLKEEKVALEEKLAVKAAELQQISQALDQIKKERSAVEQELDGTRQQKAIVEAKLTQKNAELEQALQQKSVDQGTHTKILKDLQDLRAEKDLLEGKLSSSLREVEELRRSKRLQEELAAQQAVEFDKMVRELDRLQFDIKQKEEEYRLAKESAVLVAADGARRIEELHDDILRLEMKLENTLNKAKAAMGADDPVWARIRELENSLMQAHMDYRLLNQEIRRMRRKRGRPRDDRGKNSGLRHACQAGGPNIALQLTEPGLTIDYSTKLKVSSAGDDGGHVKDIQVYGRNSDQDTCRRLIPVETRFQEPEIPIHNPTPYPETIVQEPSSRPQTAEKERYFPSHGPLRIRRGLSPGRDQR
ncbi:hypothetical protein R1sor_010376 [Riccia sorocarpa]|uniref:Uncharacterized protein n=1 Tax=Riccia sorocarpa TaxID=122646 RepID=A0ABD3HXU0_9MARC